MRKRCHDKKRKYILLAAFGVGLLVACFCPPRALVAILSITVIILGISCAI